MNRKVKYVKFQTPIHVQGIGEFTCLPPPVKTLPNLEIVCMGADGLSAKFMWENKPQEVWIPTANAIAAILEPVAEVKVLAPKGTKAA